jgi:hypothetical protein
MQIARLAAPVLAGIFTLIAVACGSEEDSKFGDGQTSGSSSSGTSGGSSGFGTSTSGGASSGSSGENCAATSAQTAKAKVDMIFVIDNSGSMTEEMEQIKVNVNNFAGKILNVGLDLHVIFIVARASSPAQGGNVICVPAPLAGANCADNLPTFRHVPQSVSSNNSFSLILSTYDSANAALAWNKDLRLDSTKIFVEVTDDESNMTFQNFDTQLLAKQPAGIFGTAQARKYIFHSIISKPFADPVPSSNLCIDPDTGNTGADGTSLQYQEASKVTGGLMDEVCKKDYSGVLDNIAKSVVDKLGCELTYPKAEAADPTKLVVQYTPMGQPGKPLTQVTDTSKCSTVQDGWYYDDNANPTKIILCPSMCTTANAAPGSKIEALVGCKAPLPR